MREMPIEDRRQMINSIYKYLATLRGNTFYWGLDDLEYPMDRFEEIAGQTLEDHVRMVLGHLRRHVAIVEAA